MNKRSFGSNGLALLQCINPNPRYNRWHVRWDVQPVVDEEGNDNGVSFKYKLIEHHKPTLAEIKEIVLADMNAEIDKNILEGFEWNGMKVWLSSENQFNYKAAYDLAIQTSGANLPVVFKFGTTEEPVYHEFEDVQSLTEFYTAAMVYINKQLVDGWKAKDSVDWSPYESILNQ